MAYKKPQYPLKNGEDYIYPVTTADQVILSDGSRLEKNGKIIVDKSYNADKAIEADKANTANKAIEADMANTANTAYTAIEANMANTANKAIEADTANIANTAYTANKAIEADTANIANKAYTANKAIEADTANIANKANEAVKLSEAKYISLSGDVTGLATFDGARDIIINTAVSASKYYTATFTSSGWSASAPYTQTVSVSGIKAADNPIVDINMSSATAGNSSDLIAAWGLVGRVATANGNVTAYCYEKKPTIDISVNIMSIK